MKFFDYELWLEKLNETFSDGVLFPLDPIGKHYFCDNNHIDNVVAEWDIITKTGIILGL